MYVIVEINGQQFKAEEGKKSVLYTTFRTQKTAQLLNLKKVLLVDNNGTVTVGAQVPFSFIGREVKDIPSL